MPLISAVKRRSLDRVKKFYEPGMAASWAESDGSTLLTYALGNTYHRVEICNFLLNEGADASRITQPDGRNYLHILFEQTDFVNESREQIEGLAGLAKRLIDCGADVNAVSTLKGTPLQFLLERVENLEKEWEAIPFYDVLFSHPELDLTKVGKDAESTYQSIWKSSGAMIMLQYAQYYWRQQGASLPDILPLPTARSR